MTIPCASLFPKRLTFLNEKESIWTEVGTVWGQVKPLSSFPKIDHIAAHRVRSQWMCVHVWCPSQSIVNITLPYQVTHENTVFEGVSLPKKSKKCRKVLNFLVLLRY